MSPPPSKPSSPKIPPAEPPRSQPVASSSRSSIESHDRAPPRREPSDAAASTSSAASSSQTSLGGQKASATGLPSPPPSHVTSSSSTSFLGLYSGVDERVSRTTRPPKEPEPAAKKRQIKHRQHIYHTQFKEDVRRDRKRTREEMEKELYALRRKQGMQSSLHEFRGWLAYKERLEMLERRDALSPSPSLVDLRRAQALGTTARRRSSLPELTEPASPAFLERALRNAQATLRSPKPPPPFSPRLDLLRQAARLKDEEIEQRLRPKPLPLPDELPPEAEAEVDALMRRRGVIAKCVREQVSDKDLVRLRPGQWLNDEIINFYGQLIMSRSEAARGDKENKGKEVVGKGGRKAPLNAHYFSTFFWTKLKDAGYEKGRLSKWTKKFDLFSKDVILIPVNHNNAHWTGAAINFRRKRIESYDSMSMDRSSVFALLRNYLDAEHRDKKKKPFDFTGWVDYCSDETPQQENGYDCGVFTCQFLEALSRGEEYFAFTQANMPYLRRRMIWEIGHAKLREDP
ncbi:hypothetical protein EIP86_005256 [Pleurotus ostreatoroseus]|nr:hypothetical protein EIP86_005256 [Pleurotus ostreatoroseus]